jgi:hypothetical protein
LLLELLFVSYGLLEAPLQGGQTLSKLLGYLPNVLSVGCLVLKARFELSAQIHDGDKNKINKEHLVEFTFLIQHCFLAVQHLFC